MGDNFELKKVLKPNKLKVVIGVSFFLFSSLVPIFPPGTLPIASNRAQPILLYLIFFTDKIDTQLNNSFPSAFLYAMVFLSAYFFIYFFGCVVSQGIAALTKNKKNQEQEQEEK